MPKAEYDRARAQHEQATSELFECRDQLTTLRERLERQIKQLEEADAERKTLLTQLMQNEQALQERSRDLELSDIKIESLESVLKRRD